MTRRRTLGAIGGVTLLGIGAVMLVSRTPEVKVLPEKVLPQVMFAKFRIIAPFTHQNSDDPIVAFGQPGVAHPNSFGAPGHLFFCNPTVNAFSTYETLVAATSKCDIKFGAFDQVPEPGDRAGYWIPTPIFGGVVCDLDSPDESGCPKSGAVAWYSNPEACPSARVCSGGVMPVNYTFPRNFRMIVGTGSATSAAGSPAIVSDNIFHNCYPAKGKTFGDDDPDGLNQCKDLSGKRADVWMRFPSCWVGRGGDPSWMRDAGGWVLDSPNHQAHMAYPTTSGCPASHPIVLPQLQVQVEFPAVNGTNIAYSCGKWVCIHFDFLNAWDQLRLEQLTAPTPPLPAPSSSPTPSPSPTCTRRC